MKSQFEWVVTTDVGEFPMPAHMIARHAAARMRRDGWPDQRFNEGRKLAQWFREFQDKKREEYQAT